MGTSTTTTRIETTMTMTTTTTTTTGYCEPDTGGTCRIWKCHASRGPTKCSDHKCICQSGYCSDDTGVCRATGTLQLADEAHDFWASKGPMVLALLGTIAALLMLVLLGSGVTRRRQSAATAKELLLASGQSNSGTS